MAELTDRSIKLATQAAKAKAGIAFGPATKLPGNLRSRLFRNELAIAARTQDTQAGVEMCGQKAVTFHYNGEPVLRTGIDRDVFVTVDGKEMKVDLAVPAGWSCRRLSSAKFRIGTSKPVADQNFITVKLPGGQTRFAMLGPGLAKGYPAGVNVPTCATCRSRVEVCTCKK
jgi:hypothetical protein